MSKTLENKTKVMTPLGKGTIIGFEYFLQTDEKGTFVKVYSVRLDYRMQNENYYDKGLLPIFLFTENQLVEKNLIQAYNRVSGILLQYSNRVEGKLEQGFNKVGGTLRQHNNIVEQNLYQGGQVVRKGLDQSNNKVDGDLYQNKQEVKGKLFQDEVKIYTMKELEEIVGHKFAIKEQ